MLGTIEGGFCEVSCVQVKEHNSLYIIRNSLENDLFSDLTPDKLKLGRSFSQNPNLRDNYQF